MRGSKWIYLSYFMDEFTSLYGGEKGVIVSPERSILNGDTANTKRIRMHNHSGTHVDFPNHFIANGNTSEQYDASFWVFEHPFLLEHEAAENETILFTPEQLQTIPANTDFLILKTGFGKYRDEDRYSENNPGLSPDMPAQLRLAAPGLKAIGVDLISITAFQQRPLGRLAHKAFLGGDAPILLVEDMDLSQLTASPHKVICTPLLIKGLDGSPVTIVAYVG